MAGRGSRVAVLFTALGLVVAVGACSSDGDGGSTASTPLTVAITPVLEADCTDEAGDTEVPGIDLVQASVRPNGDDLEVVFTTSGPIAEAPEPLFSVSHGDPATQPDLSFELRAEPDASGRWGLTLITFPTAGGAQEQRRTLTSATVTAEGTTLRVQVPQADLPKIATRVWLFGAASGAQDASVDLCESFGVDDTAPVGSVPTTAPPTTVKTGAVGEELPAADGGRVILHRFDAPAKATRAVGSPGEGKEVVAADVEICAGRRDATGVGATSWSYKTADNRVWPVWLDDHTNDPPLASTQRLPAGQCVRGWVNWSVDAGAVPNQVIYDLTGNGFGPFLTWQVG